MAMKYFLYSNEQLEEKNKILAKTSKKYAPGYVIINNRKEPFTQLSDTQTIPRFVDTRIVAMGELKDFVYKMPETVALRSQ